MAVMEGNCACSSPPHMRSGRKRSSSSTRRRVSRGRSSFRFLARAANRKSSTTSGVVAGGARVRRRDGSSGQSDASDEEVSAFACVLRLSVSPGAVVQFNQTSLDVDVSGVLPAVRVPTLILYRPDAPVVDYFASAIAEPRANPVVVGGQELPSALIAEFGCGCRLLRRCL